jgi:hypothetical protein
MDDDQHPDEVVCAEGHHVGDWHHLGNVSWRHPPMAVLQSMTDLSVYLELREEQERRRLARRARQTDDPVSSAE